MVDTELAEAGRVGDDDRGIDRAFERAAERDRDGADEPEAAPRGRRHPAHVLPLVGARLAQVLLRVGFARRHQQADLVDAETRVEVGQRALDRAHVGAGRLVVHARRAGATTAAARSRRRIAAPPSDWSRRSPRPAGSRASAKRSISAPLRVGRHEVGLVLQAVAREALAQNDVGHQAAPALASAAPSLNLSIACSRSLFFCTLPLAVMPMASKLSTIAT